VATTTTRKRATTTAGTTVGKGRQAGEATNSTPELDAVRAEVPADEAAPEYLAIPVGKTAVRVRQFLDWPWDANELLASGRYSMWLQRVLHPDDQAEWMKAAPTNREMSKFLADWQQVTGIPLESLLVSLINWDGTPGQ
jgi:hypothetical protein